MYVCISSHKTSTTSIDYSHYIYDSRFLRSIAGARATPLANNVHLQPQIAHGTTAPGPLSNPISCTSGRWANGVRRVYVCVYNVQSNKAQLCVPRESSTQPPCSSTRGRGARTPRFLSLSIPRLIRPRTAVCREKVQRVAWYANRRWQDAGKSDHA